MKLIIATIVACAAMATTANAEVIGVSFAVPPEIHSGYTALGVNAEGTEIIFQLPMDNRTEMWIMAALSAQIDLTPEQLAKVALICWVGGPEGQPEQQGCGPLKLNMGWHNVWRLPGDTAPTN